MSIHPSLRAAVKGRQQRSVLKRMERLKGLLDKDEKDPLSLKVYGLPKTKILKVKIKKEKAEKKEEGAVGVAAAPAASAVAKPAAKSAAKPAAKSAAK